MYTEDMEITTTTIEATTAIDDLYARMDALVAGYQAKTVEEKAEIWASARARLEAQEARLK